MLLDLGAVPRLLPDAAPVRGRSFSRRGSRGRSRRTISGPVSTASCPTPGIVTRRGVGHYLVEQPDSEPDLVGALVAVEEDCRHAQAAEALGVEAIGLDAAQLPRQRVRGRHERRPGLARLELCELLGRQPDDLGHHLPDHSRAIACREQRLEAVDESGREGEAVRVEGRLVEDERAQIVHQQGRLGRADRTVGMPEQVGRLADGLDQRGDVLVLALDRVRLRVAAVAPATPLHRVHAEASLERG